MKGISMVSSVLLSLACRSLSNPVTPRSGVILFKPLSVTTDSVHNIHVRYGDDSYEGGVHVVYGDCNMSDMQEKHHEVGSIVISRSIRPERFIWIVPEGTAHGGCLHAYSGSAVIGRSAPITVKQNLGKREEISAVADVNGPWFDGVAYMQAKQNNASFVAMAKSKKIAIVGGGMSGLMTSLLLESVGIHDWHITESSQRIGGRIRTKYLAGTSRDDYQYQEMGPMRFPVSVKYPDTNETLDIQDHKMVFQLADVLNQLNGNGSSLAVKFIPWIQSSPNVPGNSRGFRLPNGRIPSVSAIRENSSLANPVPEAPNEEDVELAELAVEELLAADNDRLRNVSQNVFRAHKEAIEKGLFHWSEAAYLRYALNMSADSVDFIAGSADSPLWGEWYDTVYFMATQWRTIDKGLESLPRAFLPHVQNRLTLGRKIEGLQYNDDTGKISLQWRQDPLAMKPESEDYDYAVVSVPFSKVRLWKLPPYSSLLTRAISTMNYQQSCKVALHYKTRFWEKLSPPIIGGCGTVDIAGIGSVCYPAYEINSTRPGVILASYSSGTPARSLAALSTADHIGLVQRAMIEVHGEVAAEQFTGAYERQCWETDEHQAGAWAAPSVGQQELYIPAYYETESSTIFIGEHTSYTHAWIFSALDSAVRGTTQLLLDMGLVDEAKEIVETWMGRWIHV
ncbi:flavin-containing amine oxidoreductase-domain containing protein [Massariosphaeria phaeospora]|uniref:Flavin-containing amine oxidoreductase-domain containing protein n=1 Tax=Massariosphaeria phaeospora TaxID=100035 RepID=A0A7C8I418_9PLEO|nr:flavin-containing amine oxidoreductase-domain containing protein [Massariosphaeria phaeospora]